MPGDEGLPEVVVVPAYPAVAGERRDVRFELRRAESGDAVGIAFTTLEKLIERLGRFQPWIVMKADHFCQLLAAASVTTIVLDPHVVGSAPQWSSEAVDALMEVNDFGV
jgi:flavin reductase (DIM6/NTAB) family NADH-FMN oxidoreductase RutF